MLTAMELNKKPGNVTGEGTGEGTDKAGGDATKDQLPLVRRQVSRLLTCSW